MESFRPPSKTIAWNGLEFTVPKDWEAVVTGKQQLLFEHDLEPELELKWQKHHARSLEQARDKVIKQLSREFGQPDTITAHSELTAKYLILQFTWQENNFTVFFLFCPDCHTGILVRPYASTTDILQLQASLHCHSTAQIHRWAVQDFSFSLPDSCLLDSYTFAMGFSRISFKEAKSTIHLCRMRPASTHLRDENIDTLLKKLTGCTLPSSQLSQCEDYIELKTCPSITAQLKMRLKRQKPFIYGRLWHHKPSDKLLGFTIEDIKPPSASRIEQIYNSHEATIC